LEGGEVFSEKKQIYKGPNQTENFIGAKTGNDIYYRGEKHFSPFDLSRILRIRVLGIPG